MKAMEEEEEVGEEVGEWVVISQSESSHLITN